MKKVFLMVVLATTIYAANAQAPAQMQAGPADPAAVLAQAKQQQKPGLIEKAGLTDAQADKLIEINFEMRMAASNLRELSEADRSAKISELQAAKERKISALLTAEQIQAVNAFYKDRAKSMVQKPAN